MPTTQADAFVIGGTQVNVGTLGASSFPVKIQTPTNAWGGRFSLQSGQTLFMLPNQVAGASMAGATAIPTGSAVLTTSNYPFEWQGPATFFLAAGGATCVVNFQFMFTSGATMV